MIPEDSERQSRKFKKGDCLEMTAFDRYGAKKARAICGLLFPRTTKSCSMAGCNQEVPSPAFYSGVRALAAASGGSARGGVGL